MLKVPKHLVFFMVRTGILLPRHWKNMTRMAPAPRSLQSKHHDQIKKIESLDYLFASTKSIQL